MMDLMGIEERRSNGDWEIRLRGELDLSVASRLAAAIDDAGVRRTDGRVIVDLGELDFIDSAGLRVLMAAHSVSESNGKRLRLRRGPRSVHRLFEVTGTDSVLPFE
jgi:anti-sigma B factor antagonist